MTGRLEIEISEGQPVDPLGHYIGRNPADIVSQGDNWLAFRDINPQAPSHILVIPKKHVANVTECNEAEELGSLFQAASGIAREEKLDQGFRLVVNTG
ncbi:MAG TPA: HIT domain-containing protein, partial [Candidatus Melainabacteria bacterium]|nr:HIT domain-containing protein [Candidatus Melainabacteria bacterium]